MRRSSSSPAFTLVEMLMVMVIIGIIAALIVQVAGYANKKSARARAQAEIKAIGTACESYKADNGSYPRAADSTEGADTAGSKSPIDPRLHGDATASNYTKASLFLYQQLSGDTDLNGHGGDGGNKVYWEFSPRMLGGISSKSTSSSKVTYLQDPFGFSYGYSTAGSKDEDDYRVAAATTTTAKRSTTPQGYNVTFDLWSTCGVNGSATDEAQKRWEKNW